MRKNLLVTVLGLVTAFRPVAGAQASRLWTRLAMISLLSASLAVIGGGTAFAQSTEAPETPAPPEDAVIVLEVGRIGGDASTTISVPFEGDGSISLPSDLSLGSLSDGPLYGTLGVETCYWAKPKINISGEHNSYYYIEWCGKDGKVTKVLTLFCRGADYYIWDYRGCSIDHGSVGYSSVYVDGRWSYRAGAAGWYVYRTHRVEANHYHNGYYSGTWYAS